MTKAGPFPHPASMIPVVGLFLLAGIFSDARPALADCPPPPGVTSPVAPSVTAQQVEDGSAALKDFTLAAREQFVMQLETAENLGQVVYYGCLFRQEGSYWHSGSTYLVVMRADGSVLIHAKNMALSSRRLDPLFMQRSFLPWEYPQPFWPTWHLPILQLPPRLMPKWLMYCRKNRMPHSMRPPLYKTCDLAYRVLPAMPPHICPTFSEARL